MQQEEARQPERADHAQLLVDAPLGLARAADGRAGSAPPTLQAQLRQALVGVVVVGVGIAVAEVLGQVEGQRLRQPPRLGHRIGMVLKARGHRRRRGQHVGVVAPAQRLGGIQRRVLADRHEGVLQARALARVGVDVAGRHARHAQPPGQRGQAAVERPVMTREGALQLDAQAVGPEGLQQPAHRRLVAHAALRATAQADEPLRMLEHVLQRHRRVAREARLARLARVGMGAGQQPAEVAPAGRVAHQQRQMACRRARPATRLVLDVDLGPEQRSQAAALGRLGELHRPRQRVVVGQRDRVVAQSQRRRHDLVGHRGPVEERVGGMQMELDVGHGEHMFACPRDGVTCAGSG